MVCEPRYITIVAYPDTLGAGLFANAVFLSFELYLVDFRLDMNDTNHRTTESSAGQNYGLDRPLLEQTDALRWLDSQPTPRYHGTRPLDPQRELGNVWTGMTFETYLARKTGLASTVDSEVLIVAWRTREQRQYFLDNADAEGRTWARAVELPLRNLLEQGTLSSLDKWSITHARYHDPRDPMKRPATGVWRRVWTNLRR